MTRKLILLLALVPAPVLAQQVPSREAQIASAVASLPETFQADATVLGYERAGAALTPLRTGTGAFICLADDPRDDRFHTACYQRDLEPFMARGRALRAEGHTEDVDSVRFAEVSAGTLRMPDHPAALYSVSGPATALNAATGAVTGGRRLYVVYIPFATSASTGLPSQPVPNAPWIMFPGTPKAHIMFFTSM